MNYDLEMDDFILEVGRQMLARKIHGLDPSEVLLGERQIKVFEKIKTTYSTKGGEDCLFNLRVKKSSASDYILVT